MNSRLLSSHRNVQCLAAALVLGTGLTVYSLVLAAPTTTESTVPPSPVAPGDTRFDLADRLAITNMLTALVYNLDEERLDQILPMMVPEFTAEFRVFGEPIKKLVGRDKYEEAMAKRFAFFKRDGITRRKVITPPYFIEQTQESAHFVMQFLNSSATNGANWRPIFSAVAEFRAAKRSGVWYFTSLIEITDSAVDLPASKLLPGVSEQK